MRFRETDVVVKIGLNVEVPDFTTASTVPRSLVDRFAAATLEIKRADPEGGRKGFNAWVDHTRTKQAGETDRQAVLAAVRPVLAAYGLNEEFFDFYESDSGVLSGHYGFDDVPCDGYTLFQVSADLGGGKTVGQRPAYVTRDDFTPREDDDVISRVHLRVPVRDPSAALDVCRSYVSELRASTVAITSSSVLGSAEDFCEVVLLSALPAGSGGGDDVERRLRAVADRVFQQVGVDGSGYEVRTSQGALVGAFEIGESAAPGQYVRAVYVRVDDDPFCTG
ncbi:hypothetical protein [Saccharothrix sp. Mg75]|uniref:hypothetical protein n=1 Tax=Saccharothrix sp. Mg75 TaxID=3445357 RepID=UPI003EEB0A00